MIPVTMTWLNRRAGVRAPFAPLHRRAGCRGLCHDGCNGYGDDRCLRTPPLLKIATSCAKPTPRPSWSYEAGGVPVGAVMVENGTIIGRGHNRRVQDANPVSHGETDCMKNAGRRPDYSGVTMYTTLSPCMMCTGTILQFGIPRVVIGEAENFAGNIEFLSERGVEVVLMHDEDCIDLMSRFIEERPDLWYEDIAGNE